MYQAFNVIHCIGADCDRAGECEHHYSHSNFATAVDWSTYGSGTFNTAGNSVCYACGPLSDPPYAKFKPFDFGHFCLKADDSVDYGIYGPQWSTLEIVNCREISLKLDSIGIETKLPLEYIDQVQEIEINGNRFVRVEPKQLNKYTEENKR